MWFSKPVWIKKWCHLFSNVTWILLLLIPPYCSKQLGLPTSCCSLWRSPVTLSQMFSHPNLNGQVLSPDKCTKFCMGLICVKPPKLTEKKHRLAFSLGSDLLFDVTKGHVKLAKQLVMGLGMKSITGSEKVCKILHKFGHAVCHFLFKREGNHSRNLRGYNKKV